MKEYPGGSVGGAAKLTIIFQQRGWKGEESLKQKLRCNNILTILARKMWPGIQKRKVESLTMHRIKQQSKKELHFYCGLHKREHGETIFSLFNL